MYVEQRKTLHMLGWNHYDLKFILNTTTCKLCRIDTKLLALK